MATFQLSSATSLNLGRSQNGVLGNGITEHKILGLPKLKTFADDKSNVTQNVQVVLHGIENIVGKEENAGYQHFLLFPHCFQKAFSSSQKLSLCGNLIIDAIGTQLFLKQQILDSSKLKEFADDNFKLDENGTKSFKQAENSVGKKRNC